MKLTAFFCGLLLALPAWSNLPPRREGSYLLLREIRTTHANPHVDTVDSSDPLNRQTKTVLNNRGLPQLISQPSGNTNQFLYDAKVRLTNRTDAVGTTTYKYDANNNLTK